MCLKHQCAQKLSTGHQDVVQISQVSGHAKTGNRACLDKGYPQQPLPACIVLVDGIICKIEPSIETVEDEDVNVTGPGVILHSSV